MRVLAVRHIRQLSTLQAGRASLLATRALVPLVQMQQSIKEGDAVAVELRDAIARLLS